MGCDFTLQVELERGFALRNEGADECLVVPVGFGMGTVGTFSGIGAKIGGEQVMLIDIFVVFKVLGLGLDLKFELEQALQRSRQENQSATTAWLMQILSRLP